MSPFRLVAVLGLLLLAILGWFAHRLFGAPDIADYADRAMPSTAVASGQVSATFLGGTTVLFDDGETAILVDGFFTRPSAFRLMFGTIAPARELIAATLHQAGIRQLAAVVVSHSNHDHAMDAPEIARVTGATVIGSASTANIARGWGLPESQIVVARPAQVFRFGRFEVSLRPSGHVPEGRLATCEITTPLEPPVPVSAYRGGNTQSILVSHAGRNILVNAAAGFAPGALQGVQAEVVFLGVGMLGRQSLDHQEDYWREVVTRTGARRVILIHWDNITLPLDRPLAAMPRQFDDLDVTMRVLARRGLQDDVDIRLPVAWQPFDPFLGLAGPLTIAGQ